MTALTTSRSPPPQSTRQVRGAPATPFPFPSTMRTTCGTGSVERTSPDCPSPETLRISVAAAAVSVNVAVGWKAS